MEINELRLFTPDLTNLESFYHGLLGLPILQKDGEEGITFQAGTSHLIFEQALEELRPYHVAFNIPENQFEEAKAWLSQRVPLLRDDRARDEFFFENWDAHAVYFEDPAGNILELIARHTIDNAATKPFDGESIRSISEVGLAAGDVSRLVERITSVTGADVYIPGSDIFAAVGDENGMFIIVRHGRIWYPDTGKAAEFVPLLARFSTSNGAYQLTGYPYLIEPLEP